MEFANTQETNDSVDMAPVTSVGFVPNSQQQHEFLVLGPDCLDSVRVGIDTVRYGFSCLARPDVEPLLARRVTDRRTGEVLRVRTRRDGLTREVTLPDASVTVACRPLRDGLWTTSIEGRLTAIISRSKTERTLASPSLVARGEGAAREIINELDLHIPSDAECRLRRVDLASDARFAGPADALLFHRSLSALDLPHLQRLLRYQRGGGRLESVEWRNANGVVIRAYVPSLAYPGAHDATFEVIRIERQWRPRSEKQVAPAAFASLDLKALFGAKLPRRNLVVAPQAPMDALAVLSRGVADGTLGSLEAERLFGAYGELFLAPGAFGLKGRRAAERTRKLRQVGVVGPGDSSATAVDIGAVLQALVEPWERVGEKVPR